MICIHPDVIESIPNSCESCPLAFYDSHNGSFFCGISRYDVEKYRKKKKKHPGCMIYDPDVAAQIEEDADGRAEAETDEEETTEDSDSPMDG